MVALSIKWDRTVKLLSEYLSHRQHLIYSCHYWYDYSLDQSFLSHARSLDFLCVCGVLLPFCVCVESRYLFKTFIET
jgi:hypothetical protein